MDLAVGAKETFVMMDYFTKDGVAKLVPHCIYPMTGLGCVRRLYTDVAVIELKGRKACVLDLAPNMTVELLRARTPGVELD